MGRLIPKRKGTGSQLSQSERNPVAPRIFVVESGQASQVEDEGSVG